MNIPEPARAFVNDLSTRFKLAVFLLVVLAISSVASAATRTWTGNTSTSWTVAGNWSGGVPGSGDDAVIPSGRPRYPTVTATMTVRNITVQSGGSMTLSGGSSTCQTLAVNSGGTLTLSGGSLATSSSTSITIAGTASVTSASSTLRSVNDLTVSGTLTISNGTLQVDDDTNISAGGQLILSGGDLTMGGATSDLNVTGTFTMSSASSSASINQDLIGITDTGVINVTAGTIDVNRNLTLQEDTSLTMSNGSLDIGGALTLEDSNTMTLTNSPLIVAGSITLSSGSDLESVNGDITCGAAIALGTSTSLTMNGGDLDVTGSLTMGFLSSIDFDDCNIDVAGSFSTGFISGITINGGSFDVGGSLTVASVSSMNIDNADTTVGGNLTMNAINGFTFSNGALDITGDMDVNGFSGVTLTTAEVSVGGSVDVSNNATMNFTDTNLDITNDFIMGTSGTLNQTGGTISVGDDFDISSTWNFDANATLEFTGTGTSTITTNSSPDALPNLTISKTGGGEVELTDSITVSGDLSLNTGGLDTTVSNYGITVTGDLSLESGTTFQGNSSTITMSGTGGATLDANGATLPTLVVSNTGGVTLPSDLVIGSALTVNSGSSMVLESGQTLDIETSSTSAININGSLELEAGTTVEIENGGAINIGSGGELIASGTDPDTPSSAVTIQSEVSGTGAWEINVGSGASIDLAGADMSGGVIDVDASASGISIQNSSFSDMPAGMGNAFIDLTDVTTTNIHLSDISFVRGDNVSLADARAIAANATTSEVYVTGFSGDLGGESADNDPSNRILWTNNPFGLTLSGYVSTNVSGISNVLSYLPPVSNTLTVTRHTTQLVNSTSVTASGYGDVRSKLVFSDFAGTVNIEGLTFRGTSSDAVVVDTSAVVSGGTVNFYNCIFVNAIATGSAALFNRGSATLTLTFCTVDGQSATAGHSSATSCIFAREAGFDTSVFMDYATNISGDFRERNLRLATTDSNITTAARHGTFTLDVDGKQRSATTTIGAHEFSSSRGLKLQVTDATSTSTSTRNAAVVFNASQVFNSSESLSYISGSDGATCYVSVVPHSTVAVQVVASFAGYRTGGVTYRQTSDQSRQFWILTPYDSNGDGTFDKIRRLLHNAATSSISSSADVTMRDASDTGNIEFQSDGGFNSVMTTQSSSITRGSGVQVSVSTQTNGGQVHNYYFNTASTSGEFYSNALLIGTAGVASESYVTGTTLGLGAINLNPNPVALPLLFGNAAFGTMAVTRIRDATSTATLMQFDRSGDHTLLNTLTGPSLGGSFATTPFILFFSQSRRVASYDNDDKISMFNPSTWSSATVLDVGLTGYSGVSGVDPIGFFQGETTFFPMYNETTGLGAVVAVEYDLDQDSDTDFEVLNASYSNANLRFTAGSGGFTDGVAHLTGKPTRLVWLPIQTSLFCSTDAGMVYGWQTQFTAASADSSAKGALLPGLPIEMPGGGVAGLAGVQISSASLKTALGMSSDGVGLLVFTDNGQVLLVRVS